MRRARKTRPCWQALFIHARIYVAVNALLVVIWALEWTLGDGEPMWFLSSLYGWGIGLAVHYLVVTQITRQWRPEPLPGPLRGRPSQR